MESLAEVWKPVKGYEGQYEVSDQGRVRSLERTSLRAGKLMRVSAKFLKHTIGPNGYPTVRLYDRNHYVHHLVLEMFVGPRPERYEACHGNGVRSDCRLENLRWDTPQSNQMDRAKHGTSNRGEQCGTVKLTELQAREILASNERGVDLAKRFGVSQNAICGIRKRRTWKHLNPLGA